MRITLLTAALATLLMVSCKKDENKESTVDTATETTSPSPTEQETTPSTEGQTSTGAGQGTFDINSVKVAENIKGSFPYFKLPEGYLFTDPHTYHGPGVVKTVDMEYLYNHGTYFPIEGKSYKAEIRVDSDKFKDKAFSKLELKRSFDEFIAGLGGEKINNGEPIRAGEKDRLEKENPNAYSDGYLHSCNNYDDVHTYVIRTKEKAVYIQFNLGSEQASYTVIEPKAFENTMSLQPAAEIKKQINESGKAVLYINFDTDKATLKPDGKKYVAEIKKLLQDDQKLRVSIEGHTDNTGTAARNRELSVQRATTVMKELTSGGIQSSRLAAKGFGSDNPLAANDTESNKAKNRRVELVRI
jgi:OOP family OmpA-OmpF porin